MSLEWRCPFSDSFKLYINQYVESWTVNLRRINNYYLECGDLHWLNQAAMYIDIYR